MIRIGFIGCGGVAREYLDRLDGFPERAHVTAFCDLDRDRAREMAQGRDARVYSDYRTMLEKEALDAVFDNLPPFARAGEIVDAAPRGCHIFTTKPLGLKIETALRSLEAIEKAGVLNSAGYMFRYSGITQRAIDLLGGRPVALVLGEVIGAMPGGWVAQQHLSGGQIIEQSTHLIDVARYLAGDIRTISAKPAAAMCRSGWIIPIPQL